VNELSPICVVQSETKEQGLESLRSFIPRVNLTLRSIFENGSLVDFKSQSLLISKPFLVFKETCFLLEFRLLLGSLVVINLFPRIFLLKLRLVSRKFGPFAKFVELLDFISPLFHRQVELLLQIGVLRPVGGR